MDINDLRKQRKAAADQMDQCLTKLTELEGAETPDDAAIEAAQSEFDKAETDFQKRDKAVKNAEAVERAQAASAVSEEASGGASITGGASVPAVAENPADKAIEVGFIVGALANCGGNVAVATEQLDAAGHTAISAVLNTGEPSAGGVTVPAPLAEKIIDLLRPRVIVRKAGAETSPLPAGQMRRARMIGGATAAYSGEGLPAGMSQQEFDSVDQSFKKLTAFVGVTSELIRFSTVNIARTIRNDVIKAMAAREDIAFLRNDGTGGRPKGLRHWVLPANWNTCDATVVAVEAFLRGCVSRVEDADVMMTSPGWGMRASAKNFLANLRDGAGNKVYPSIDANGTLHGYPIYTSSQIPNNLGAGADTEIYFADFAEMMIGDAMTLTIKTSDAASFVDDQGATRSAFQEDLTVMRAISEHDFASMHDEAISGGQVTGWAV